MNIRYMPNSKLGPTGPRWAPCWPHEPCSLGYYIMWNFLFKVTFELVVLYLCEYSRIVHWNGSLHRTKVCVYSTLWKESIIWGPFAGFKRNTCSKWIWCMETLKTYDMFLFWHGRIWCHRFRHMGRSRNDITQRVFLKFILCPAISYNDIPFQTSMEMANWLTKSLQICPLFQLMCHSGRHYNWKHFMDISASQFLIKNTTLPHLMFQMVQMLGLCSMHFECIAHLRFCCSSWITIWPLNVAKLILGSLCVLHIHRKKLRPILPLLHQRCRCGYWYELTHWSLDDMEMISKVHYPNT